MDPPAYWWRKLAENKLRLEDIPAVFLSHIHEDHMAGVLSLLQYAFEKSKENGGLERKTLVATPVVYRDFIAMAVNLTGRHREEIENWFVWEMIEPGERLSLNGRTVEVRDNTYLHMVPTYGMRITAEDRSCIGYSCDIYYDPQLIDEMHQLGWITDAQRNGLFTLQKGAHVFIHEMGMPPTHTKQENVLKDSRFDDVYLLFVHTAQVAKQVAEDGTEYDVSKLQEESQDRNAVEEAEKELLQKGAEDLRRLFEKRRLDTPNGIKPIVLPPSTAPQQRPPLVEAGAVLEILGLAIGDTSENPRKLSPEQFRKFMAAFTGAAAGQWWKDILRLNPDPSLAHLFDHPDHASVSVRWIPGPDGKKGAWALAVIVGKGSESALFRAHLQPIGFPFHLPAATLGRLELLEHLDDSPYASLIGRDGSASLIFWDLLGKEGRRNDLIWIHAQDGKLVPVSHRMQGERLPSPK